jgi:ATP-binding cassette subfamily B protein
MTAKPAESRRPEWDVEPDPEEGVGPRPHARTAWRLLARLADHRALLVGGSAAIVVSTAAALVEPRLLGYAIDDAIIPRNQARLIELATLFGLLTVVRAVTTVVEAYLFEGLGQAVTQDLRLAVLSKLQRLPLGIHDRQPPGRLMTRVTNDVVALAEIFSAGFVTMISNALLVTGILVWLLVLNVRLGLIAASVLPVMLYATGRFSGRLHRSYREARSRLSALNAYLAETLMGVRTVHLFNRQAVHLERFSRLNHRYTDAQAATIRTYAYLQPAITLAAGTSMALVIWFGSLGALDGVIPLGVLVTYFAYVLALFRPMRDIADKWNVFLSGLASAERIFAVLDWPTELSEEETAGAAPPYPDVRGTIRFEHVWFAYDAEHWVLRDVTFEVPAGTWIGVVGHTGSGKSTLVALLMRFYEPQRGRILLDGRDIREYDRRRLRTSIGMIQQEAFLFAGTIAMNVEGPASAEAFTALEAADLGRDHPVGERGGNLSAGQRQLVAHARARARAPRVWILDEATANMDADHESRLHRGLLDAAHDHTVVLIAHRLATTRPCGLILVMHKGEIVERGDHHQLLDAGGLYARLYRYQAAIGEMPGTSGF